MKKKILKPSEITNLNEGFYRVKLRGDWMVAEYCGFESVHFNVNRIFPYGQWFLCGNEVYAFSFQFDLIDTRIITFPKS
jgi:hypothetical protein